ncbi:1-acyl dihydroxyacetone phosphate reductase [Clohesyomyces aquaticus]|uniref:1-acyl dihydroxyacetone phosphate reductase n=1 Tax=Clohesyomyces aquaticus TaxID=1231657 RepID=A0A1Y2A285_9PLEO|nr:1-acyl dihydroxyacetone phosphate reductase [Clohesyomyces aquaticus]
MSPTKSVLITGCSDNDIGSALALTFQKQGFHNLPNTTLLALDVANDEHIRAAVEAVKAETGILDYLINNAGRNHFMPILDETFEGVKKIFRTNFWAPIQITNAFAPVLVERKGTVVIVTSIVGYVITPFMGSYSASKRALEIIAEHLRVELEPFGVSVLSVVTRAVKSMGQTYFEDFTLPENSLYKLIEVERMGLMEYAAQVVHEITKGTTGKFWCGAHAEMVKMATQGPVPQKDMVSFLVAFGV